MPGKGLEKRGGVPPSHKAMAGQVEEGKKDRSSKRSFSPPQLPTLIENIANYKKRAAKLLRLAARLMLYL